MAKVSRILRLRTMVDLSATKKTAMVTLLLGRCFFRVHVAVVGVRQRVCSGRGAKHKSLVVYENDVDFPKKRKASPVLLREKEEREEEGGWGGGGAVNYNHLKHFKERREGR